MYYAADDKKSLHVAGWGLTDFDCTTNERGPVRGNKCRLPFTFKGTNYTTCSVTKSPSAEHKECRKMKRYKVLFMMSSVIYSNLG